MCSYKNLKLISSTPCIFSLSKLQVLSFMFTPNYMRCPFFQTCTGVVLNLPKFCMLCPLGQTQLDSLVKSGHVYCT
ncbi:hypothetical protein Hanom_Chr11g01053941 [Helianthus anomalus]